MRSTWNRVRPALTPVNVVGALVAICLALLLWHASATTQIETALEHDARATDTRVERNKQVTCALARLVAYVPAMQFQGEPVANFESWIEARQHLLEVAQVGTSCDEQTRAALRERAELDAKLLAELRAGRP